MKPLLLLGLLNASIAGGSSEQAMSFTVTGETVPRGAHQLLVSSTPRFGRPKEYVRFDNLAGFGYGVSSSLEAQLLVAVSIESVGLDGKSAEGGGQGRVRWQPLDSRADPVGLGVLGTVGVSSQGVFLEARVGAELWLGEFLLALNASLDYRIRRAEVGPELHLEQSGGIVYRLGNGFTTGFEARNRLGFQKGEYYGDAVFLGPVLGFRHGRGWFSVAALPQVAAVKARSQVGNGEPLELRDNERVVLRLQVGFDT